MNPDSPRPHAEDDPFDRLIHTHRRIEERLADLQMAADELGDPARRMQALDTILDVVGFFERAARRHHDDEEDTLFPRLREAGALEVLVQALEGEHDEHDAAFAELARLAREYETSGPSAEREVAMPVAAAKLAAIYRSHIEREEKDFFPAARAALSAEVIAKMGTDMAARRGGGGGGGGRGQDRGGGGGMANKPK